MDGHVLSSRDSLHDQQHSTPPIITSKSCPYLRLSKRHFDKGGTHRHLCPPQDTFFHPSESSSPDRDRDRAPPCATSPGTRPSAPPASAGSPWWRCATTARRRCASGAGRAAAWPTSPSTTMPTPSATTVRGRGGSVGVDAEVSPPGKGGEREEDGVEGGERMELCFIRCSSSGHGCVYDGPG